MYEVKNKIVWDLIQDYKSKINKTKYGEEIKEMEFSQNYLFVDIRKNVKKRPSFPHIQTSKEELLFNYEEILDKKNKYIILDKKGIDAAIISKILNYFNYNCFYIKGGLRSYKKWTNSRKWK